jgi:hypothetical protein
VGLDGFGLDGAGFTAGYPLDLSDDEPPYPDFSGFGRFGPGVGPEAAVLLDQAWARTVRRFARVNVWGLPLATACFALAGMWGWPKASSPAPAAWLAVDVVGLVLTLVAFMGLAALFAPTPARRWSLVGLYAMVCGAIFIAPVLGLLGVARPSLTRETKAIGANTAANLRNALFDATVSRWLGVCGLVLAAVAWFALGCAVMASGLFNRNDGFLFLGADAIAVAGAYVSWQFLLVIAAMVALAASLGVAWTATRLAADGRHRADEF